MRRWIAVLLIFLGLPTLAVARCAGSDLLAALASSDAATYRRIESRAEAIDNGQGVFWRVERAGAPPSFLFGTYHDPEIAEAPLDPQVAAALEGARVMLAEVTLGDQATLQDQIASNPRFALDLDGPGLAAKVAAATTPADRAAIDAALAQRGLSLALIDRLRPALLLSILALPQCAIKEMAAGKPVLDSALMARAEAAGTPVIGMEHALEAIDRLEALPRDVLDKIIIDALLKLDQLEDFRRTAVALYRKGDMGMMEEFSIWASAAELGEAESRRLYDVFATRLIGERNHVWLATLVPELEKGGAFAAFGALHLPGKEGIIELLRAEGFTVTRLDG